MANNEGLLELNGKDIVQVIGEEAVPRTGDIDATTYNQKNYVISGSTYSITKDTPDVLYLELTGDFTFTCTGAENANRTIKVQIHKASTVSATTTITWNGVTEWLTDGNSAPVFGQVASTEQNLVVAVCLSNTVVLANTLYNSENGVSGGAVTIAGVNGLQDALDAKADSSALSSYLPLAGGTITGSININRTDGGTTNVLTYNNEPVLSIESNSSVPQEYSLAIGNAQQVTDVRFIRWGNNPIMSLSSTPANTTIKAYDGDGNVVNVLSDKLVRNSGDRGTLAGYENTVELGSEYNWALSQDRPDSTYWTSTVDALTVRDGTAGTCWTKTVKLNAVPTSVSFGSNWNWVGGSAPTLVANGLLVCTWQNSHGLINFLSPSA